MSDLPGGTLPVRCIVNGAPIVATSSATVMPVAIKVKFGVSTVNQRENER